MRRFLRFGCLVSAALVGILTALALVCCVRVLRLTPPSPPTLPALNFDISAESSLARLQKALTFQTISHDDPGLRDDVAFSDFRAFLREAYPRLHAALECEVVGDGALLYTWHGTAPDQPPIMLLAHHDVVNADPDGWQHPPFSGVRAEGFVWGRGALDNKANLISILEAIENLLVSGFSPTSTIYLVSGHDEETGGNRGAGEIAKLLESRGIRCAFSLDEGGAVAEGLLPGLNRPMAMIALAEKGYATLELRVHSEGGHSSRPPRETAAEILCRALLRLESTPFPPGDTRILYDLFDGVAPYMPSGYRVILANQWLFRPAMLPVLRRIPDVNAMICTTTAVTKIRAGEKENVIPAEASALVNHRLMPGETLESLLARDHAIVDDTRVTINTEGREVRLATPVASTEAPAYRMLAATIRQCFPGTVVAPGLMVAGSDSKHMPSAVENIYHFGPMRMTPELIKTIHGANERIGEADYVNMIRFWMQFMTNLNGEGGFGATR